MKAIFSCGIIHLTSYSDTYLRFYSCLLALVCVSCMLYKFKHVWIWHKAYESCILVTYTASSATFLFFFYLFSGCGFVGRHLVSYLVEDDLVNHIRVVDKVPPPMAWLNEKHQKAFSNAKVEFKSANLLNPGNKTYNICNTSVIYA